MNKQDISVLKVETKMCKSVTDLPDPPKVDSEAALARRRSSNACHSRNLLGSGSGNSKDFSCGDAFDAFPIWIGALS